MKVEGNCTAETSAAFPRQLRANHPESLIVIWDNGPAHWSDVSRSLRATPDLRLVPLPGYSPDYSTDAVIRAWIREDVAPQQAEPTLA